MELLPAIATGVLYHEASHSGRIRGQDPFRSRERRKLDSGTSWNLPTGRFPTAERAGADALLSVVAESSRISWRDIQSRSLKWAEKQENFQPKEMCFFLASIFIELNTQKDLSFDSAQANDPYSWSPHQRLRRSIASTYWIDRVN